MFKRLILSTFLATSAFADDGITVMIGNGLGYSQDIGFNFNSDVVLAFDWIINLNSKLQASDEGVRVKNNGHILFIPVETYGQKNNLEIDPDCEGPFCGFNEDEFHYVYRTIIGLSLLEYNSMIVRQDPMTIMKNDIGPSLSANYTYTDGQYTLMAIGNLGPKFQHLQAEDRNSLGMAVTGGASVNNFFKMLGSSFAYSNINYNVVVPVFGAEGLGQELQTTFGITGASTYAKAGYVYQNFNFDLDSSTKMDYSNHLVELTVGYNF